MQLARALPAFTHCQNLSLGGHSFGDQGLVALSTSLPRLEQLISVGVSGRTFFKYTDSTTFGKEGLAALGMALPGCVSLTNLSLPQRLENTPEGNLFSEAWSALPARELVNDEGAVVLLGNDKFKADVLNYYCDRHLAEGQCGPIGGPQCKSCMRFQASARMTITLHKAQGQSLVITCDRKRNYLIIEYIHIGRSGLIEEWNISHPHFQIHANDRIVAVNDARGDSSLLREELKQSSMLKMQIDRVQDLTNDDGATVALATDKVSLYELDGCLKYYCGKHLERKYWASCRYWQDGPNCRCGPDCGPQCKSCERRQAKETRHLSWD